MNTIVYFDESGNTEAGIKDQKQPFITFASHNASEEDCENVIKQKFPKLQTNEVKYKNLGKKNRIPHCINTLADLKNSDENIVFKIYIVYKPLFLFHSFLTFFHDIAVETYDPNFNTGNPDWFYSRMHVCWIYYLANEGKTFLSQLIRNYQNLVKNPCECTLKNLYCLLEEANRNNCELSQFILKWCQHRGYNEMLRYFESTTVSNTLKIETQFTCVKTLLDHWSLVYGENKFDIIHDNSWSLKKRQSILKLFEGIPTHRPQTISSKVDNKTFWVVPDKLNINFKFEDSSKHSALQIADLLAGVVNEFSKKAINNEKVDTKLFEQLGELIGTQNFINMVPDSQIASANIPYCPTNNHEVEALLL